MRSVCIKNAHSAVKTGLFRVQALQGVWFSLMRRQSRQGTRPAVTFFPNSFRFRGVASPERRVRMLCFSAINHRYHGPAHCFGAAQHIVGSKLTQRDRDQPELHVLRGLSRSVPLVSFEANLPEFLEETKSCVATLAIRDSSVMFNYVTEEQDRLELAEWLDASDFARHLAQSQNRFMEIYCRSHLVRRN